MIRKSCNSNSVNASWSEEFERHDGPIKDGKQCLTYMKDPRQVFQTQILSATLEDIGVRPAESHVQSHLMNGEIVGKACSAVKSARKTSHYLDTIRKEEKRNDVQSVAGCLWIHSDKSQTSLSASS